MTVTIPPALRPYCEGRTELELTGGDVRAVVGELARLHPEVHRRLFDERGDPRPHINIFINEDHVRARDGLASRLNPGDVVTILPAVSGG